MATDNVLGERAKELRQQLGMTQGDVVEALARKGIEVKQAHVSNIESGARLPSLGFLSQKRCSVGEIAASPYIAIGNIHS